MEIDETWSLGEGGSQSFEIGPRTEKSFENQLPSSKAGEEERSQTQGNGGKKKT